MCLYFYDEEIGAKKLFKDKTTIVCYKVVRRYRNGFITPYRRKTVTLGQVMLSDRKSKKLDNTEKDCSVVAHGIHVYLSSKAALESIGQDECVIRVFCNKRDYVAHSEADQEAVFMKIKCADKVWRYYRYEYSCAS